jgi:hypothetical protein
MKQRKKKLFSPGKRYAVPALLAVAFSLSLSCANAAPPAEDKYALRSHDGVRIWEQLSETDIITLNGHVYRAGPAYSPKATCGSCHDYDAITRAYHFREGTGPNGEGASDHWSDRENDGTLYKYLANAYGHLRSPGQFGAW